jgi:hypothetical protein
MSNQKHGNSESGRDNQRSHGGQQSAPRSGREGSSQREDSGTTPRSGQRQGGNRAEPGASGSRHS